MGLRVCVSHVLSSMSSGRHANDATLEPVGRMRLELHSACALDHFDKIRRHDLEVVIYNHRLLRRQSLGAGLLDPTHAAFMEGAAHGDPLWMSTKKS